MSCQSEDIIIFGLKHVNIIEKVMLTEKHIHFNLDVSAGSAYYMMGLPVIMSTSIFAISRVFGWVAHLREQKSLNRPILSLTEDKGIRKRYVMILCEGV